MPANEEYLGDGLYARDEGFQFRVWTDRMGGVHEVYFEDNVLQAFFRFIERTRNVKIKVTPVEEKTGTEEIDEFGAAGSQNEP